MEKNILLNIVLCGVFTMSEQSMAQSPQGDKVNAESQKEWVILAHPDDVKKIRNIWKEFALLKDLKVESEKEKKELKRVMDFMAKPAENITLNDLKKLHRVRSIQVNRLGVFKYPYFHCRFTRKKGNMFFEKTSGSQRKSGIVLNDEPTQLVFLGAHTVNDNPQKEYSRLMTVPPSDRSHDIVGVFVKRAGKVFAIFSWESLATKRGLIEFYEFK